MPPVWQPALTWPLLTFPAHRFSLAPPSPLPQCTILLAACYPRFPDPAAILAQLLDCDDDAPQEVQPMQLEELP